MNKKIIMYCGSLKPGKGIPIILKTAKRLKEYQFVLVGGSKGVIKHWIKRLIRENIRNVYFTGFIAPKFVPFYLKSADILIMPYDLTEKESIMDINTTSPLKLFEYMASKRPIITTRIPTIEKIITNEVDAILTKPNNLGGIIYAIERLINDKKLAKKLTINAYEKATKFTYKKRCEMILKKFSYNRTN